MARVKSFTLVELMVAVSILSIGLVFVLRSYLTMSGALNTCALRISAIQFLETRMEELEEKAILEKGIKTGTDKEDVMLDAHEAVYSRDAALVGAGDAKEDLDEAILKLAWKEANKDKDEVLAGYIRNKK